MYASYTVSSTSRHKPVDIAKVQLLFCSLNKNVYDSVIMIQVKVILYIDCMWCRLKELGLPLWKLYVIRHTYDQGRIRKGKHLWWTQTTQTTS